MGGSADPEPEAPTPSPSPSPAKASPSPSSADAKRLRRCVQSKLLWGSAKSGCGGGGGGGAGAVPAAEEAAEKEGREEPEKGKKRGRPRKSEAGRKPSSNKEISGLDPGNKDEIILVDESPQKKQRKGKNQGASMKVPNRKRCKALEFTDGHESCQQLNISQTEAVLPETSPVSIDIDLMSVPSEARQANDNVDALDNQDKSQLIVDLRSEAKIAAEENRRLSSGKKTHPFFASRKVNKGAGQDVLNIEDTDSLCAFERDPPFWPIHVVYQLEASMPIHWSKWLITEGSFLDTSTANALQKSVSFFEGLVKPLTIETNCKRMRPDQLAEQNVANCTAPGMGLPTFSDKQSENMFSSLDVINIDDKSMLASNSSCRASLFDNKHLERILHGLSEVPQKGFQLVAHIQGSQNRYRTESRQGGGNAVSQLITYGLTSTDLKLLPRSVEILSM